MEGDTISRGAYWIACSRQGHVCSDLLPQGAYGLMAIRVSMPEPGFPPRCHQPVTLHVES